MGGWLEGMGSEVLRTCISCSEARNRLIEFVMSGRGIPGGNTLPSQVSVTAIESGGDSSSIIDSDLYLRPLMRRL